MVQGLITEEYLDSIAEAIREKNGSNEAYYPSEMAEAILNIPTASGGLDLTTSLVLSSDKSETSSAVTLTGVLQADYDDLTPSDVDLHGYLEGATVKLYDSNNTLLGTGITDSDGIVNFNETISADTTFYCSFEGTSDYNHCISNEITVEVISYLFYDKCDSATTLSNYDVSQNLRSSGRGIMSHNDGDDYHTITNTKDQGECVFPIFALDGVTDDFSVEFDSYIVGEQGSSGFVIYNNTNNWVKLTDDGNNKYWLGYNINGRFTESSYTDVGETVNEWIHSKFTIQDGIFRAELSRNDTVFYTKQYNIPSGFITSNTRFGIDCEWWSNSTTRYKNIKVVSLSGE